MPESADPQDDAPAADLTPWVVLARSLAYDASPWLRHWVETVQLPNGHVYDDFHVVDMTDFAIVFALTDDGHVVAEHNYRHGAREVCLVLPAGFVDAGETPQQAAQRELMEETGYAAREWQPLGSYVVDGNRGCGQMHAFLARGAAPAGAQHLDPMEQIEVSLLSLDAVSGMLARGEFRTLATAAATGLALNILQSEVLASDGSESASVRSRRDQ